MTRINYGINKREDKRIVHKCGKLFLDIDESAISFHDTVLSKIRELHPHWNITGYHFVKVDNKEA